MKEYNKMIRTKIPYIISNEGKVNEVIMLDKNSSEAKKYIYEKLIEEANEVIDAKNDVSNATEELGDLYEVMLTVCDSLGISMLDVVQAAENKALTRGKFINNDGKIPVLKSIQ